MFVIYMLENLGFVCQHYTQNFAKYNFRHCFSISNTSNIIFTSLLLIHFSCEAPHYLGYDSEGADLGGLFH